jgi:glutamyl-tRNA(Gln) amidotransferase subunit E
MEAACLTEKFIDVTAVFKQTTSKILRKALNKHHQIKAVKLPNFNGFLKRELMPDFRLGTELADSARFWGRVGGIFHTDELPAYGVTAEEVEALMKAVNAGAGDAVVFVAAVPENAEDALRAVVERAREVLEGIPAETRAANADGTTRYMRPRPGAARMYPETDIPPSPITSAFVQKVRQNLPEPAEKKLARLMKDYNLNEKLAKQVVDSDYSSMFEVIARESGVSATTVAAFLTETLKALKRDGVQTEQVSEKQLRQVFGFIGCGELAKEAAAEVVTWLAKNEGKSVQNAVTMLGLNMFSEAELAVLVDRAVAVNRQAVDKLGKNAFSMLMGLVMKEVRGKADPELVSKLLKERLK